MKQNTIKSKPNEKCIDPFSNRGLSQMFMLVKKSELHLVYMLDITTYFYLHEAMHGDLYNDYCRLLICNIMRCEIEGTFCPPCQTLHPVFSNGGWNLLYSDTVVFQALTVQK